MIKDIAYCIYEQQGHSDEQANYYTAEKMYQTAFMTLMRYYQPDIIIDEVFDCDSYLKDLYVYLEQNAKIFRKSRGVLKLVLHDIESRDEYHKNCSAQINHIISDFFPEITGLIIECNSIGGSYCFENFPRKVRSLWFTSNDPASNIELKGIEKTRIENLYINRLPEKMPGRLSLGLNLLILENPRCENIPLDDNNFVRYSNYDERIEEVCKCYERSADYSYTFFFRHDEFSHRKN